MAKRALSEVQDLQYGEVLYHYYQQDYFTSIVRVLTAQQQETLPHHAGEAELLLGGLDLSYGLRNEAEGIFQRLLTGDNAPEAVRNRAWFYLAKISWQRGEPLRALQALERIEGDMPDSIAAGATQLHALVLMQQGHDEKAIEILQNARGNRDWSPYLRYNLGVAWVRTGRQSEGAKELERVGDLRGRNEELRLLRDKANLALGYSFLQAGEAAQSRQALERVRLEGPLSNKALLGTGWADAETEAYGRALVPWTELSTRNPVDPAVQESLLAVPYAMTQMNLHGRAVQHYEQAIEVFIREQERLDAAIEAIRAGELVHAVEAQASDAGDGGGWLQRLAPDPETPALRYALEMMADHAFQEAVKNYRDLLALQANLESWAVSIEAYDEMLAGRRARYASHLPAAERGMHSQVLEHLERRHAELSERIARIEAEDDPVGLADPEEARQWERLAAIAARIKRLPSDPKTRALLEKQQQLQGILYWQLNADYKPRLWRAKQQSAELAGLLARAQQSRAALQQAGLAAPAGFEGFDRRIAGLGTTIDTLLTRTNRTRTAQGALIEQLAVSELERQQKRLETYLIQARFALAQTYDSALQTTPDTVNGVAP